MDFRVIIPARYDSTRLPGKMLIDIAGKPMIQHVYERARDSGASSVVIATDSDAISEVAQKFGAEVCMTLPAHASGTERLTEVVEALDYDNDDIVLNVQGDQPLIPPETINQLACALGDNEHAKMASICEPIESIEDLMNPSVVKVVLNKRNCAMYFSRSPIPWNADLMNANITISDNYFRHIGLYGYRVELLKDYVNWVESPYEALESLEQLRVLWNGHRIHMSVATVKSPPEVNTPADLEKIRALLRGL